jgi:hypothetical protein
MKLKARLVRINSYKGQESESLNGHPHLTNGSHKNPSAPIEGNDPTFFTKAAVRATGINLASIP